MSVSAPIAPLSQARPASPFFSLSLSIRYQSLSPDVFLIEDSLVLQAWSTWPGFDPNRSFGFRVLYLCRWHACLCLPVRGTQTGQTGKAVRFR